MKPLTPTPFLYRRRTLNLNPGFSLLLLDILRAFNKNGAVVVPASSDVRLFPPDHVCLFRLFPGDGGLGAGPTHEAQLHRRRGDNRRTQGCEGDRGLLRSNRTPPFPLEASPPSKNPNSAN
jgi:hypothetical protein